LSIKICDSFIRRTESRTWTEKSGTEIHLLISSRLFFLKTLDYLHVTGAPAGGSSIGGMPPHVTTFLIHHPRMLQNHGLLKQTGARLLQTSDHCACVIQMQ
jgi:hypothetical protein